jgi:hypothetical protein
MGASWSSRCAGVLRRCHMPEATLRLPPFKAATAEIISTDRAQALLQASRDPLFESIAKNTQSILFLGTPHSGSSFTGLGAALARLLRPIGSNPSILDELEYDSVHLLHLHHEFVTAIGDNIRVVNFFEERETNLLKVWFFRWNKFVSNRPVGTET